MTLDTALLGTLAQSLSRLADLLHVRGNAIAPGNAALGPWDAMIVREAGPDRSQPLHGLERPFNPAERWPPRRD
jgi:hypothetical protein